MEIGKIDNKLRELKGKKQRMGMKATEFFELSKYEGEDKIITSEEALNELNNDSQNIFKCSSGIKPLDDIIGDFREGQLIVLSAPTGQGKTSFLQSLTYTFAEQDINSVWFSYEVGVREFLDKMPDAPIFFLPKQVKQNNLEWLEMRVKESIAKYGCQVVFIDHLHYLIEMQKMAQAKSLSLLVGMMMRELKRIAIENEVAIFLVSHMRKVYLDSGKMPDMDDLRDSSFVGQESDLVMFLIRMTTNDEDGNKIATNDALLRVAKNRRLGNLGYVKLEYINNRFNEKNLSKFNEQVSMSQEF